ncbi:hypothetical protein OKA04_22200 [Luteolibacter flavescens]|uniref:Transglutaminase-like domain-containing protein n=1 Tax=Luteolibacter flavescens TaxID=1859460 RepID=A0ABT3FW57_9BACT|nr:hypothetical protein [Luteolibacter flavescens]MCW1887464.1 hypothetical protein [Luteolibacter flavescens]
MKEPRKASPSRPPGSPIRTVIVRGKGNNATGSMLAVALFMAVGLGGVWWIYDQRGHDGPQQTAKKPAKAVTEEVAAAPETPVEVTPATPETTAPEVAAANVPKVAPAPATPEEAPAPAPTEAKLFGTRLAGEPVLALIGIDSTKTAEVAREKELLAETVRLGAWTDYSEFLKRSLSESQMKLGKLDPAKIRDRFDGLWKEPVFYQVFLRWQVLQRFSSSDITTPTYGHQLFAWLMTNDTAMEEVLLTVKPQDNTAKVVEIMADAWAANRQEAEKYFNLALACGVVFDKGEIRMELEDSESAGVVQPIPRYTWYVQMNEKGKLATSINKLSARDLVWVVCAPVPETELGWAIDKMHLSRSKWGNAYGMIEYLMERAVEGLNPYEEYSFAQILKEGGICGDQTYFCVNTARALGIPAIGLSGETDLGGHAWAAVKTKDDQWDTHIGRIGGAANGAGGNPQVGGDVSEQEIWLWNDKAQQSRLQTVNVFRYLWLGKLMENFYEPASSEAAVRVANNLGKAFSETWQSLYDVLVTKTKEAKEPGAPEILEAWDDFVDRMRREFRENPRMAQLAAKAESEYLFPYAKEGDARRMLARERRRIEREAGEQKDLVADSLKREADLIFKNNSPGAAKEIGNLYDKALRQYGGSITGFKRMAEDYFSFCKDNPESARKAARDIELAFQRVVETGSKDWFRANTETSIYKMICSYYRTAGDESKAVKLEKRYERLLRAAERGAL